MCVLTPVQRKKMGFAGKQGYLSSMPVLPSIFPENRHQSKYWLTGQMENRAVWAYHSCLCWFVKNYVMMPSEEARNRAGAFQVDLDRCMRGLERG